MSEANLKQIWETYVASWKAIEGKEKLTLFKECLSSNCEYHDPITKTQGWDDLKSYMLDFHKQVPGGHFVTTSFRTLDNKSIATWDMKTGAGQKIGEGISYCEYTELGKLNTMTGFFEIPNI